MFYSLFFEHWINNIIRTLCRRNRAPERERVQVLRQANFSAKSTWILRLLGVRPIHAPHRKRIEGILEVRNAFVHYKWSALQVTDPDLRDRSEDALADVEKSVRYSMAYERKHLLGGRRAMRKPAKRPGTRNKPA